jgi:hypothetical protein
MTGIGNSPIRLPRGFGWTVSVVLCGVLTLGCAGEGGGASSKLKEAAKEREQAANAEVKNLTAAYVASLTKDFPTEWKAEVGVEHPMSVWRKKAITGGLKKLALARAKELSDTPNAKVLRDAVLVFEAVSDYWLGKEVKGPAVKKEWEEGYEESKKVAAKEGERELIPLPRYIQNLEQLASAGPYVMIGDFEQLLPHVLHSYKYSTYRGATRNTSFSLYWQVMYDFYRLRDDTGPEQYQPYRDRLCKEKLNGKCAVPYESRDIVLKKIYFDKLLGQIAQFRKKYPESGLESLLTQFEAHVTKERDSAVVPEEYPVMPNTIAPVWASPYTVLTLGPNGAELSTDDPDDKDKRRKKVLMETPESWALTDSQASALATAFSDEIKSLRADGATVDYTTQVYLHFDKSIPLTVLATVASAFSDAGTKLVDFVGRRRFDETLQLRRVPGAVLDSEAGAAFNVEAHGTKWGCTPLASLAETNVVPDIAQHEIFVNAAGFTAGPKGKVDVKASWKDDLNAISDWVEKTDKPTLIGVHTELNYEQLHKVLNAVAVRCETADCVKPRLVNKLLLALCADPVKVESKKRKKRRK